MTTNNSSERNRGNALIGESINNYPLPLAMTIRGWFRYSTFDCDRFDFDNHNWLKIIIDTLSLGMVVQNKGVFLPMFSANKCFV
jgi:hypothetical protein